MRHVTAVVALIRPTMRAMRRGPALGVPVPTAPPAEERTTWAT
ncbi:hypothetical protein ACQP00_28600 [Dactylosporangium sp. CS-047395]